CCGRDEAERSHVAPPTNDSIRLERAGSPGRGAPAADRAKVPPQAKTAQPTTERLSCGPGMGRCAAAAGTRQCPALCTRPSAINGGASVTCIVRRAAGGRKGRVGTMARQLRSLQTRILVLIAACFLPGFIIFAIVTLVGRDKQLADVH